MNLFSSFNEIPKKCKKRSEGPTMTLAHPKKPNFCWETVKFQVPPKIRNITNKCKIRVQI